MLAMFAPARPLYSAALGVRRWTMGGSPWSGFLPSSLQDRWGLDARTVDPIDPLVTTTAHYAVADLNDRDHSFVEIADWIEANV